VTPLTNHEFRGTTQAQNVLNLMLFYARFINYELLFLCDTPLSKSTHPNRRWFLAIGTQLELVPSSGRPATRHIGQAQGENSMKLVTAIIKPFKLEEVRDALTRVGIHGLTVTEARGYGRQKGHTEIYRGAEYTVNFLPKLKIEVAVASNHVDQVIGAIIDAAKSGEIGDGKIFVMPLDHAVRIRTGETDETAL
jgi:nitrogen regulatory protein P-II 2